MTVCLLHDYELQSYFQVFVTMQILAFTVLAGLAATVGAQKVKVSE